MPAKTAFPPLDESTPYIVSLQGRAWLNSLGLAAVQRRPHTEVVAAIEALPIGAAFWSEHFRVSRTVSGARAPGIWISRTGFDLLSLAFPREEQDYWRTVLSEAFEVAAHLDRVERDQDEFYDDLPTWLPAWARHLFGRLAAWA